MKVRFRTSRFGELEVDRSKIIYFPQGIPGFSHLREYVLLDYKDTPVKWLQAVGDPDVAFIVVEPGVFLPEYTVEIDSKTMQILELERKEDLVVLLIIRVEDDRIVANTEAPLVFNASSMKGIQLILE